MPPVLSRTCVSLAAAGQGLALAGLCALAPALPPWRLLLCPLGTLLAWWAVMTFGPWRAMGLFLLSGGGPLLVAPAWAAAVLLLAALLPPCVLCNLWCPRENALCRGGPAAFACLLAAALRPCPVPLLVLLAVLAGLAVLPLPDFPERAGLPPANGPRKQNGRLSTGWTPGRLFSLPSLWAQGFALGIGLSLCLPFAYDPLRPPVLAAAGVTALLFVLLARRSLSAALCLFPVLAAIGAILCPAGASLLSAAPLVLAPLLALRQFGREGSAPALCALSFTAGLSCAGARLLFSVLPSPGLAFLMGGGALALLHLFPPRALGDPKPPWTF